MLCTACAGGTPDGLPKPFEPESVIEKRVLKGPEGVVVHLLQTDTKCLIQLQRVRPDLDGMVLLAELGGTTSDRRYLTQLNGRRARVLGRKNQTWTLFLGGSIQLEVDEVASQALKPKDLIKIHVDQRAKGQLAALTNFDRAGAETKAQEQLTETMDRIEKDCGFAPKASIDFSGISEAQLMKYSVSGYCDAPRSAYERACKVPELRAYLQKDALQFLCKVGPEPKLSIDNGRMTFTTAFETSNLNQWARGALDDIEFAPGRTVRLSRTQDATTVCASSESDTYVVVGPWDDEATAGVAYGRQDTLYRQPVLRGLSRGWFFEPRHSNPSYNNNFRGYDLRYYSYIGVDKENTCKLKCGETELQLSSLTGKEKNAFLDGASWKSLPNPRRAYALARDKRGIYYYVDRGATSETERDYRLFVGRQGRLRRQKMRDIVADSEGEIFASANGRLKLLLGRKSAEWQSRGRTRKLVRVEVSENLDLIYNRLGVYFGQPMHTPCDLL